MLADFDGLYEEMSKLLNFPLKKKKNSFYCFKMILGSQQATTTRVNALLAYKGFVTLQQKIVSPYSELLIIDQNSHAMIIKKHNCCWPGVKNKQKT
jgi:hypothetical protein